MFVVPADGDSYRVARLFERYLPLSRFTLQFEHDAMRYARARRRYLRLRTVRLRVRKPYCGQHAGPCLINPFVARRHPRASYLEGADWVGFDDMVNDVLDRHRVEADVWSKGQEFVARHYIRRGRARRTAYPAAWMYNPGGKIVEAMPYHGEGREEAADVAGVAALDLFIVWDSREAHGEFTDAWFGARRDAPRSSYPQGTPGIAEWRRSRSRRLERVLATAPHEEH